MQEVLFFLFLPFPASLAKQKAPRDFSREALV